MRFHIGFSKRISIKKLIEIIGFLFIACLTFFGIYDNVHADSTWYDINVDSTEIDRITFDSYSYVTVDTNSGDYATTTTITNDNIGDTQYVFRKYLNSNTYRVSIAQSGTQNYQMLFDFYALSKGHVDTYFPYDGINKGKIFMKSRIKYEPSIDFCQNETNSKSMNLMLSMYYPSLGIQNESLFNVDSTDRDGFFETFRSLNVYAHAIDRNNNESLLRTHCFLSRSNSTDGRKTYLCNNVFKGDNQRYVDYYLFEIKNQMPFNDVYSTSTTDAYISTYDAINFPTTSSQQQYYPFKYSCSTDDPLYDEDEQPVNTDPGGLNDIYTVLQDEYSTNLPGIDTSLTLLNLPTTFTDLLLLPFDVVRAVVNNSSQCTPYDLNFSSIIQRWGSYDGEYHLRLPCMREELSNKLGNWYTIADMLICFFVFYEVTMYMINLINAITSGEDLFTYFFKPSHSKVKLVDSSTGEVISHG